MIRRPPRSTLLSLHDALPIFPVSGQTYTRKLDAQVLSVVAGIAASAAKFSSDVRVLQAFGEIEEPFGAEQRSEEHTSELQSRQYLVCRLLLEKKKIMSLYTLK